jgi:hypothetical protein
MKYKRLDSLAGVPRDGIFKRPFRDKYYDWLAEAVEAPEYVVPWEKLCAMAKSKIWSCCTASHSTRCGKRRRMMRFSLC